MFEDGLCYQESHMASEADFVRDLSAFCLSDVKCEVKGGPVLYRKGDMVYTDSSDAHNLFLGDTGSMKTLRFVLPLIYSCARAGESMVIVDPKGELARKTSKFLSELGYHTHIINLRNPQVSPDKWNPMWSVQKEYANGTEGKKNATLLLNDLLNVLFYTRSGADKDRYWNESAGAMALGLCELILALGEELSVRNLLKWRYEKMPDGTLEECFESLPQNSEIYYNLAGYMNLKAENTKSCILSTFDQLMRLFKASPALTDLLSETTFNIDKIGTAKTAVFMVVPDEKTTFHFLATLFISQCYEGLLSVAEGFNGCMPIRVNFVLEEFCNMPMLQDLLAMLTAARSRNIRFHLVIQSYSQIIDKYGEAVSKAVLDNCGNLIYLHSREISFLDYISRLTGNNEYGRPLLSTSRLQHLKKNETVIFHDRCYPFVAQDIPLIFEYPVELGTELPVAKRAVVGKPIEQIFKKKAKKID